MPFDKLERDERARARLSIRVGHKLDLPDHVRGSWVV